jgi:hypothetical protein
MIADALALPRQGQLRCPPPDLRELRRHAPPFCRATQTAGVSTNFEQLAGPPLAPQCHPIATLSPAGTPAERTRNHLGCSNLSSTPGLCQTCSRGREDVSIRERLGIQDFKSSWSQARATLGRRAIFACRHWRRFAPAIGPLPFERSRSSAVPSIDPRSQHRDIDYSPRRGALSGVHGRMSTTPPRPAQRGHAGSSRASETFALDWASAGLARRRLIASMSDAVTVAGTDQSLPSRIHLTVAADGPLKQRSSPPSPLVLGGFGCPPTFVNTDRSRARCVARGATCARMSRDIIYRPCRNSRRKEQGLTSGNHYRTSTGGSRGPRVAVPLMLSSYTQPSSR